MKITAGEMLNQLRRLPRADRPGRVMRFDVYDKPPQLVTCDASKACNVVIQVLTWQVSDDYEWVLQLPEQTNETAK